tara:strand:- start:302 stop:649 length:348 start_codon:yes stop_codon:yes gene_type:complete
VSNISSASTALLNTATDAGQVATNSSFGTPTNFESLTFTPYSSGVTTVATIKEPFSDGPTLTWPSTIEESSSSTPTDAFTPPASPTYGYATRAASNEYEGPTTLRKVRKGRYHTE